MWAVDQIAIGVEDIAPPVMLVRIATPAGAVFLIGEVRVVGSVLHIREAHVDGPGRGRLGRAGLNAVGHALLAESGADEIVVEGGTRTTGRNAGRRPWTIRFPRQGGAPAGRRDRPAG